MGNRALVQDKVHVLSRKNPRTGAIERTTFTGSLRQKPVGWKVERCLGPAMGSQSGTV